MVGRVVVSGHVCSGGWPGELCCVEVWLGEVWVGESWSGEKCIGYAEG